MLYYEESDKPSNRRPVRIQSEGYCMDISISVHMKEIQHIPISVVPVKLTGEKD